MTSQPGSPIPIRLRQVQLAADRHAPVGEVDVAHTPLRGNGIRLVPAVPSVAAFLVIP